MTRQFQGHPISATLAAVLLVASAATAETGPSIDCTKASSSAEEAVCASETLSAMDRELARLYGAALTGPNMSDDGVEELKAYQRGWIKGRDECWKSSLGLDACIAREYAYRIHEIREGYAVSRDVDGESTGPFAYICDGLDAVISAVFVTAGDGMVSLKWRQSALMLPRQKAGSGARYGDDDGNVFWVKDKEATFDTTDGEPMTCREDFNN